jgi:hypothetical protein
MRSPGERHSEEAEQVVRKIQRAGPYPGACDRSCHRDRRWAATLSSMTDLFELQLVERMSGPGVDNEEAAFSVAVALRQRCRSVVPFDTTAGGAGYVAAVPEALPQLIRRARQILACPRRCDSSGHACLLDYDTQHDAVKLNCREGLKWLTTDLETALELPPDLRIFGDSGGGTGTKFALFAPQLRWNT